MTSSLVRSPILHSLTDTQLEEKKSKLTRELKQLQNKLNQQIFQGKQEDDKVEKEKDIVKEDLIKKKRTIRR